MILILLIRNDDSEISKLIAIDFRKTLRCSTVKLLLVTFVKLTAVSNLMLGDTCFVGINVGLGVGSGVGNDGLAVGTDMG